MAETEEDFEEPENGGVNGRPIANGVYHRFNQQDP